MNKKGPYTKINLMAAVLMLMALVWLTVSTPFVYESQQLKKELAKQQMEIADDDYNPFSNTTEEKSENNVNTLSEYLHDLHIAEHPSTIIVKFYKCHPSDLYFAFHPELLSPHPEARFHLISLTKLKVFLGDQVLLFP